ncbi:alpha/beta-hydrolase [Hyaloscypha variabilis F]|uniref:Alpha/beta-hydrolase n=1 Tax=Hyaloscypha variabilis (strain UAMH 11265 / GT02V1 / F) TaxID=1149755 RepID=A0A2J6SB82_HYAVF|nr:alpha/beta-hydrolase [Hyaloscypha variabilis F]
MAGTGVDLLRMRLGSSPSISRAITRPNISFLSTIAGTIRIRDSGGVLPSLIFACDGPNVLEHYDAIFSLLSPSYRLICLDMPGFGFSYPSSTFDFSLHQYANVVAHAIKELKAEKVTLMFPCAWSYVAFLLAAENPELVDRLVVSQCPHWDEEQAWARRVGMNSGLLGTPVVGQLFLALASKSVADRWYQNALPTGTPTEDFAEPARKVLDSGGIFCLASLAQTWARERRTGFVVEQPTVVLWGGSDRTHRKSNPDSVLGYLKSGKVMVYPEAGHFPELEDPERLRSLLANKKLWNGLRINQMDPGAEVRVRVAERLTHEENTTVGIGILDRDHRGHLKGRRKPPDSHL